MTRGLGGWLHIIATGKSVLSIWSCAGDKGSPLVYLCLFSRDVLSHLEVSPWVPGALIEKQILILIPIINLHFSSVYNFSRKQKPGVMDNKQTFVCNCIWIRWRWITKR